MGDDAKKRPGAGPDAYTETASLDANAFADSDGGFAKTLPSTRRAELLATGTRIGRFAITDVLGAGGMGVVYEAQDIDLDRRVALKLLRAKPSEGGTPSPERRARLLREARALARLNHPNVITVYEVGVFETDDDEAGDRVFIAMELVEGGTLSTWLAGDPRPWRDVVDVMLAAGRGLAAAHAADLIHRDFKPDNVLVGRDGRVRVTDFGLAAVGETRAESPPRDRNDLASPGMLTRTGAVIGTPLYMSPEQYTGGTVDARSDQFSFCVTLFQALYRTPPFDAGSYAELADAVTAGRIAASPRGTEVPSWLDALIRKGLSTQRADRVDSMADLLAAIEHGLRRRRRVALGAAAIAAVVIVGAGAAALAMRGGDGGGASAASVCTGARGHLAEVWNQDRQTRIAAAFAGDPPHTRELWPAAKQRIDLYGNAWVASHTSACRAARVHKEQSEQTMELRMACLERRRAELRELLALLESGDAQARERVSKMVPAVAELARCADAESLRAVVAPPPGATANRVAELRDRHARLLVRYRAGRYEEIQPELDQLVNDARELDYAPLLAEVLLLQGNTYVRRNRGKLAVESLREAANVALGSRHDVIAAQAWASVIYPLVFRDRAFDEAERAAKLSRAAISRLGGDPGIESILENNLGLMEWMRDRFEPARDHLERAIGLREKLYGKNDHRVASSLDNLGSVLHYMNEEKLATRAYERALAIREATLGKSHPDVAATLTNLSLQYGAELRFAEAAAMLERAVAIKESALGPDNPGIGTSLINLGEVYISLGRFEDAIAAHTRALRLFESVANVEPRWRRIVLAQALVGYGERLAGRPANAIAGLERARALLEQHIPDQRDFLRDVLLDLADAYSDGGDHHAARATAERAVSLDDALEPDNPARADAIGTLGRVEAAAGRRGPARKALERALALRGDGQPKSLNAARERDALARLSWPRDRKLSFQLARAALTGYELHPGRTDAARAALTRWMADRVTSK